jgi:acyl-CoA hydrolase
MGVPSAAPAEIGAALDAKRRPPDAVFDHIEAGADLIVGLANAEPVTILDALEAGASDLEGVQVHQMFPLRERSYMHGEHDGLHHVSWFLSPVLRDAFHKGTCSLVPNHFSEVPHLMRSSTKRSLVLASASPPDRHGYFSLGCHAEYVAALIGEAPFFVEANARMPRTFGENQVHVSDVVGWCEADYPLVELPDHPSDPRDQRIAELVAERIPDGATLQAGIGSIPNEVLGLLRDHKELGAHTELLADGYVDLVESGALTGTRKNTHRNKIITTSALGKGRLYEFVGDNPGVEFWPVSYTNDPRVIGLEDNMRAINASLEVDFLGQCASESLGSEYWSSSGGQPDFARGVLFAENGASFIVLHSTTTDEEVSRIVAQLHPGAAVTSHKNVVDHVVTEYGVAELRGRPIGERARKLIDIAHPKFRDELARTGRELGYL